jgi:mono/diheme cytochrome c family protein
VIGLLAVGLDTTVGWRPLIGPRARPLTGRTFEHTPARLARGRYLAEHVSGCMECHSPHDWSSHDAPTTVGLEGAGQDLSVEKGLPGRVVAPNLTPDVQTGAGTWSDDALARAIREGIGHDGRALFPLMPFEQFRTMSDEDMASIVVFLRTLTPAHHLLPATSVAFPVNYLMRAIPEPILQPVATQRPADSAARGAYLVTIAACSACHTPQRRGAPISAMSFGGGFVLNGPWGRVASANLTPDPSGIPYYDERLFVNTIRTGRVVARPLNQVMPWHAYRNMTDEDLTAIFGYLKTLAPVRTPRRQLLATDLLSARPDDARRRQPQSGVPGP